MRRSTRLQRKSHPQLEMMTLQQQQFANVMAQQQQMMFSFMREQHQQQQQNMEAAMKLVTKDVSRPQAASTVPTDCVETQTSADSMKKDADTLLVKEKFRFMKKVKTFLRTKDLVAERKKEVEAMNADTTFSKMPPCVKPYKPPTTEGELDEVWSKAALEDVEVKFTFSKGTTRRRALEQLHWFAVREERLIFHESAQSKLQALETASRKQNFEDTCKEVVKNLTKQDSAQELGLELVQRRELPPEWLDKKITELYADVIQLATKERQEDEKKKNARKEKDKAVDLEMTRLKPEEVIAEFVDQRVKSALKKDDGPDGMDCEDGSERDQSTKLSAALSQGLPKNDAGGSGAPRAKKQQKPTHPKWQQWTERPVLGTRPKAHGTARRWPTSQKGKGGAWPGGWAGESKGRRW